MKVKLELFEGPLDLLLHLIRKEELDIYDIPISDITRQYLEYIDLMKMLDLNVASEFLVMAATLMHIKSKMLLPQPETPEEAEEEDPRAELVKRLLEYKKFKEAAGELYQKGIRQKDYFRRGVSEIAFENDDNEVEYFEASVFELITAFTKIMKEVPKQLFHEVLKDEFTVDEKIHDIFHILVKKPIINLSELIKQAKNKLEIITTFLALLELIRLKEIVVKQTKAFGDMIIERNKELIKPKE
ncbi:MAG: segregation/condensation protein A [Candidatus Omnitrophica bacterium]|nr:segregation/condensation protein A [Candidatus Omnitrophota bacterium]